MLVNNTHSYHLLALAGFMCLGLSYSACGLKQVSAAEEILVIEQDYKIIEHGKNGPEPRDIRQKMYLAKDWVRIDEYAGLGKSPSETYLIDFKTKLIINLDNENLTKVTEKFKDRRKRIGKRKKNIEDDLKNMADGPQKDKTKEMYRALLDDNRKYQRVDAKDQSKELAKTKKILDKKCELAEVIDKNDKSFKPLQVYLHPTLVVPYDSAEVLYLLQLIGANMAKFLQENDKVFKRLPMEMHLQLAAGGKLDTKVVSIEKTDSSSLNPELRKAPPGYREKKERKPPPPKKPAQPAESIDPDKNQNTNPGD